eukprot:366130-Chlamydomonas_euryale.AAC.44
MSLGMLPLPTPAPLQMTRSMMLRLAHSQNYVAPSPNREQMVLHDRWLSALVAPSHAPLYARCRRCTVAAFGVQCAPRTRSRS